MKLKHLVRTLCAYLVVTWGLVGVLVPEAQAQQESDRQQEEARAVVEPTDAQATLNDEGVRSLIEGDYAGAVALLERSVRLGELNVTYLNLGRAYQKLGNCEEAHEALQKAKTAPPIADPPASEVSAVADRFLGELAEQCPEESASQMAQRNSEQEDPPAAEQPSSDDAEAKPDKPADTPTEQAEVDTDVDAGESADAPMAAVDNPEPSEASGGANLLGWGTTISGLALIGGGVALHFVAESDRAQVRDAALTADNRIDSITQAEAAQIESDADRLDTIGLAAGITGAFVTAVGTYFLLTPDETDPQNVSLSIGGDDVSVTWTSRF